MRSAVADEPESLVIGSALEISKPNLYRLNSEFAALVGTLRVMIDRPGTRTCPLAGLAQQAKVFVTMIDDTPNGRGRRSMPLRLMNPIGRLAAAIRRGRAREGSASDSAGAIVARVAAIPAIDRVELWSRIVQAESARDVLELGVYRGEFSDALLRGCPGIRRYYMLDPWRHLEDWNKPANVDQASFDEFFEEALRRTEFAASRRVVLRGTTTEVIDAIADETLDVAYIDGDHTLRGIAIDLIRTYRKIRPGGILGGDDYTASIWQHPEAFEPSLVCPFAAYFAESQGAPLVILPFGQFAIIKPLEGGAQFRVVDTTSRYGPRVLAPQIAKRDPDPAILPNAAQPAHGGPAGRTTAHVTSVSRPTHNQARKNLLFVMADQFRRDALVHMGGRGRTRALDQLADGGTSFRQAITNSPECIPARFALATGLYPRQTGVEKNGPQTLSPTAWTWMRSLADAGYRTSIFGKTHFHESAQRSGDLRDGMELMHAYGLMDVDEIAGPRASLWTTSAMTDSWRERGMLETYRQDVTRRLTEQPWIAAPSPLGLDLYYDTYVGRRALDYLSTYDRPEPWFCWVSFAGPHEPWDAPEPYDRLHAPDDMWPPLPRTRLSRSGRDGLLDKLFAHAPHAAPALDQVKSLRANYAGNVSLIDDQIGSILDFLRESGQYESTLIVFTSDHGEMNGDHGLIYKSNFLGPATDIPLIVRSPAGTVPRTGPSNALVELIDVGTTILDYAGLSAPEFSNGRSLKPLIEGSVATHRDYVVSEYSGHTLIATDAWKCEFDARDEIVLLYDRIADPLEQDDRSGDRAASAPMDELRSLLRRHRTATAERRNILEDQAGEMNDGRRKLHGLADGSARMSVGIDPPAASGDEITAQKTVRLSTTLGKRRSTSVDRNYAFVHIQKTGGTAIAQALGDRSTGTDKHRTALELRHRIGEASWARLYSFAFVRNPWDRLVSWWSMIDGARANPINAFHRFVLDRADTFEQFLRNCDEEFIDDDGTKWIYRNQSDYLSDEAGRIIVDYVGRFENIDADFDHVSQAVLGRSVPLVRANASSHGHYSDYYSDELADHVRERYQKDIAAFGYGFSRRSETGGGYAGYPGLRGTDRLIEGKPGSVGPSMLPLPPYEMRQLVGPTDEKDFDNPSGAAVFPGLQPEAYRLVVDFGCGCGRLARQLIQQKVRPRRYIGFDLHQGMIRWCTDRLAVHAANFSFVHHDIYNAGLNPDRRLPDYRPIPVETGAASLIIAWSVLTHMTQDQIEFYLGEIARVLDKDGVLIATLFIFDKSYFPMMQDDQNTLYINSTDPTNATIFDRQWLRSKMHSLGLGFRKVTPPQIRGYHWLVEIVHLSNGQEVVDLPVDKAPFGRSPPPKPINDPSKIT